MADGRRVLDIDLSKYDIILVDLMGCEFTIVLLIEQIFAKQTIVCYKVNND